MLKIDKFQQLITYLLLKSDCYYVLMATYMIFIHIHVKAEIEQKLQQLYE